MRFETILFDLDGTVVDSGGIILASMRHATETVLARSYTSGFSLGLMAKDIRTADELASAIGVPAPLADATAALWSTAAERLGSSADHTEIGQYLASIKPG